MKVVARATEKNFPAIAVKAWAQKKLLKDLLGDLTLEEVIVALLEKDAFPGQIMPGIGIPAETVRAAKVAMKKISKDARAEVKQADLEKSLVKFQKERELLVFRKQEKQKAEQMAQEKEDKLKDKDK